MRRIFTPSILWGIIIAQSVAIVVLLVPRETSPVANAESESTSPERRARTRTERIKEAPLPPPKGRRYFAAPKDPDWTKTASTLNPEKARELLERNLRETTNVEERAEKAWHIINQLCQNGYTNEAWALIDSADGAVRQKGIGGFFRDAKLSDDEMISMLDTLKTADRSAGLYGYFSRLSPEEFASLDMSRFPLKSGFEHGAFERAIGDLLKECYDPENPAAGSSSRAGVLSRVIDQTNAGTFSYWQVANVLKNDPSRDGFLYWEVAKNVSEQAKANQRSFDGTDAQIIRVMTAQDPERTLSMASVPGSREYSYYHIAMMEWLNKDFAGGEAWYQKNVGKMAPEDVDRSAVAFTRASVRAGNLDIGEQWMEKIQSDKWRNAVSYERAEIAKKKATNAQGQ